MQRLHRQAPAEYVKCAIAECVRAVSGSYGSGNGAARILGFDDFKLDLTTRPLHLRVLRCALTSVHLLLALSTRHLSRAALRLRIMCLRFMARDVHSASEGCHLTFWTGWAGFKSPDATRLTPRRC